MENFTNVTEKIVNILGDKFTNLVDRICALYKNDESFNREMIELTLKHDIAKSMSKYLTINHDIKPNGNMYMVQGKLTMSLGVYLHGEFLGTITTDVIEAGGYNIQAFHYRFITKTSLSVLDETESKTYKAKINSFDKIKKLESEVESYNKAIMRYQDDIISAEQKLPTTTKLQHFEMLMEKSKDSDILELQNYCRFFHKLASNDFKGYKFTDAVAGTICMKRLRMISDYDHNYHADRIKVFNKRIGELTNKIVKLKSKISELEAL